MKTSDQNSATQSTWPLITTATTTGVPVSGWKLSLPNQSCQTACGSAVCNVTSQSSLLRAAQLSYVNGLLGSATCTSVSLSSSGGPSITSTRACTGVTTSSSCTTISTGSFYCCCAQGCPVAAPNTTVAPITPSPFKTGWVIGATYASCTETCGGGPCHTPSMMQ